MWRNILGMGAYQATVLITLLFAGVPMLGLKQWHYDELTGEKVFDDVLCQSDSLYYTEGSQLPLCKVEHYTIIFHTFVFMQVFNEINARKLGEREFNVFAGFFNNGLFISVILITIVVQCVLVEFGGQPIRAVPLKWYEHVICIGIGAFSLIISLIVKFIPSRLCNWLAINEKEMTDEEEQSAFTTQFRKSFRQSIR